MKVARHCVFRKNLLLMLSIAALLIAGKWAAIQNEAKTKKDLYQINECVAQCNSLTEGEKEAFIVSIGDELDEKDPQYSMAINTRNVLFNSLQNTRYINRLISFAKNKEGVIDTNLPANYENLLGFYAELSKPTIINEQPLEMYFALKTYNIVPIVVLFLNAIFWGSYFEEEIYKIARTAYYGAKFEKVVRRNLLLLGIFTFCGNEIIDLMFSGMLNSRDLWSASLQSYREMKYSQINITIGTMLVILWCSQLLNILFVSIFAEHIARKRKSVKDTAVLVMIFIIIATLLEKVLQNSPYYSIMQIGHVNYKKIIAETIIIIPVGISTGIIGLVGLIVVVMTLWIYGSKRIKMRL